MPFWDLWENSNSFEEDFGAVNALEARLKTVLWSRVDVASREGEALDLEATEVGCGYGGFVDMSSCLSDDLNRIVDESFVVFL
jgi:hypothetical protein